MANERTYYAWSPIVSGKGRVKVGEAVSQGDMPDEDWAYLIECGAIRTREYPVPESQHATLSPVDHLKQEVAKMQEGMGYEHIDEEAAADQLA